MLNNTSILCDFKIAPAFAWEAILQEAGFRNNNPFNPAIWSLQGLCDVSIHDMSFSLHPFHTDVINKITPAIEETIRRLYNCNCAVEIGDMVTIKMWK